MWVLHGLKWQLGTAAVPVGTAGYCGYCKLQGVKVTVGYCTVRAGTAEYCGYCGYCRVLGTVGTALGTVGTAGVYCRVLQGVQKVRALSTVRNTYRN